MEFNRRKFLLGHLQGELGIGKKHQLSLFIFCQKFRFYPFKFFEFLAFRVFRFNPGRLVHIQIFISIFRAILVFQPVLNYLKLQSAKRLLIALNDNIQRFEKAHGEIRDYEKAQCH